MKNNKYLRVEFEDYGQDLSTVVIDVQKKIICALPPWASDVLADIFLNAPIKLESVKKGGHVCYLSDDFRTREIRYSIKEIRETDTLSSDYYITSADFKK